MRLKQPVARYAFAGLIVAAALALIELLEPLSGTDALVLLFLPSLVVIYFSFSSGAPRRGCTTLSSSDRMHSSSQT
jgi:hypothetical protein